MEFSFIIDDIEKRVAVEKKGDGYAFSIDDVTYAVNAAPLSNGTIAFFVDNRSCVAVISRDSGGMSIELGGRMYRLKTPESDAVAGAGHGAGHGDGSVTSPMPGNIIAVHVAEGDSVTSGQAVVVIESMKMQNEITAPISGTVTNVACSVGAQVGFGDMLVEIEPAAETP
jgi:biotin carboxyl carrier protein